jgi:hypothetical protein
VLMYRGEWLGERWKDVDQSPNKAKVAVIMMCLIAVKSAVTILRCD